MNNSYRNGSRRGRPIGFKLSEESKRAISESKRGQCHKQETKDKISRSLIIYFKSKNPVSEEIINYYCRTDNDEVCGWINDVKEFIDCDEDIMTERALRNKQKMEITCGSNIELFSHRITPELLIMFKEYCEKKGIDTDTGLDQL